MQFLNLVYFAQKTALETRAEDDIYCYFSTYCTS